MTEQFEDILERLFKGARSHNGWRSEPVTDGELEAAYEISKWGPTSMNTQPLRFLFLHSEESKLRLKPALTPRNVDKVITAPVVAIFAYDLSFHTQLSKTFPHNPAAQAMFTGNEELTKSTAFRNSTLQAAYFMLALRAVGLDVGPMSGFDASKIDDEFFQGTSLHVNFICGIGHGDSEKVFDRLPRLDLKDVSQQL